jgi:hypothetical protein
LAVAIPFRLGVIPKTARLTLPPKCLSDAFTVQVMSALSSNSGTAAAGRIWK